MILLLELLGLWLLAGVVVVAALNVAKAIVRNKS